MKFVAYLCRHGFFLTTRFLALAGDETAAVVGSSTAARASFRLKLSELPFPTAEV